MKSILKATLIAAVIAGVFNALASRLVARQAAAFRRNRLAKQVPTLKPVADAKPYLPLQESDLHVAQNLPV